MIEARELDEAEKIEARAAVRRRIAVVPEVAEPRFETMLAHNGAAHPENYYPRLTAIVNRRVSIQTKIEGLWAWADEVAQEAEPYNACRRGCSHCCHIAVGLPMTEARVIGRHIRVKPVEPKRSRSGHGAYADIEYGYHNPCVFLKDGECSIYASRPLTCRLHMNFDIDDLLCWCDFPNHHDVPMLDTTFPLLAMMHAGGGPGDYNRLAEIREVFPRGKS